MAINGYGYGDGDGSGYGYGYGYGDGDGSGYGYGYGDGYGLDAYLVAIKDKLDAHWVLAEPNAELKRQMIEAMGSDRFFRQLDAQIVHQDTDGCGNPRKLVRVPLADTKVGYLQAVQVVCPTTHREYFLGVPPTVKTCQEAVASTFGIKPDEYHPERES